MKACLVIINSFKNYSSLLIGTFFITLFSGCGAYNFTGGDVGTAQTFQVNYFQNYATQRPGSTFDPGLDREFTLALQDLILTQTSLDLVGSNGDLFTGPGPGFFCLNGSEPGVLCKRSLLFCHC